MIQKKIEDHVAGIDISANDPDPSRIEILPAARPGMPATDDLHQNHFGCMRAASIFRDLHMRPIAGVPHGVYDPGDEPDIVVCFSLEYLGPAVAPLLMDALGENQDDSALVGCCSERALRDGPVEGFSFSTTAVQDEHQRRMAGLFEPRRQMDVVGSYDMFVPHGLGEVLSRPFVGAVIFSDGAITAHKYKQNRQEPNMTAS
jgi:hypothetical protein